jgi:hypothetical protein
VDNSLVPVTHACNPSYSGGRDQEDCSSKPAQANSLQHSVSKNTSQKGLVEWLKVEVLSSSPSTAKKKNLQFMFYHVLCLFHLVV